MSDQGIKWFPRAFVEKWDADQTEWVKGKTGLLAPTARDFHALNVKPVDTARDEGNLLTTAGLTRISNLIVAAGGQGLTATSGRIGVGNGAGSAVIGDTDLGAAAGSSNRFFNPLDSAPSVSAGVITLISTFASANGNFAWNEWGVDIGTPTVTTGTTVNATLLNHKTSAALGTKASGASWAFTVTITLS